MFKKQDIDMLPFDKMAEEIERLTAEACEDRLAILQAGIAQANARKIKMYAKDAAAYFESEAGSDGIEEQVAEVANLDNPLDATLTAEQKAECRREASQLVLKQFLETYEIAVKFTWIMPQLRAAFGNWKAVKNEAGMYDGKLTLAANCKGNTFNQGLWYLAMHNRTELIGGKGVTLYKVPDYGPLVPLILSGFRINQNIPYSAWDKTQLHTVVNEQLCSAMLASVPELSAQEWLDIRRDCLVVQSGAKKGASRDPKTTTMLYGLSTYKKHDLANIPKLALVMKSQIWCAHPANRGPYMVLDPNNWDIMPEPLIEVSPFNSYGGPKTNIFKPTINTTTLASSPWDD